MPTRLRRLQHHGSIPIVCRIPRSGGDGYRQMSESDIELLARYRRDRSEDAFSEIVRRHLALVHSAALRQVRLPQLAEEIAQTTFVELARQVDRLQPTTQLAAWLYEATRRNSVDVLRRESRRDARERTAMELNSLNAGPSEWSQLEPVLDDAMAELPSTDRTAILLRYFENRSLRDVGAALGVSDDAAQKRVSRAVDELRSLLIKRGVTVGAGALVAVISGNAVQAAPAALALTVAACSAKVAVSTAVPSIAMNAFTKSLIATSAISLAVGVYQGVQANRLKEEVRQFAAQTTELAAKTEELTRERDEAARRASAVNEDLIRANSRLADMAALRSEVDRLRPMEKSLRSIQESRAALSEESLKRGRAQAFLTRQFKVDAKKLRDALERVFSSPVPLQGSDSEMLKLYLGAGNIAFSEQASFVYDQKVGLLTVRHTEENQEAIKQILEALGVLEQTHPKLPSR